MKMKLGVLFMTVMLASILGTGVASAAYSSSKDTNVNVYLLQNKLQPSSTLGNTTFQLQEGIHNTVTNITGISVDHSYIWIKVNGYSILAIDPPQAMY